MCEQVLADGDGVLAGLCGKKLAHIDVSTKLDERTQHSANSLSMDDHNTGSYLLQVFRDETACIV